MPLTHAGHATAWPYAIAVGHRLLAIALRRRREVRGWSIWRTAAFLACSAVLAIGLAPN